MNYRIAGTHGYSDAYTGLLEKGFDPLLVKLDWTKNHFGWIIWKLFSLSKSYPNLHLFLTFQNVVEELAYRAQTNIYDAKRSCIQLLYERDESPGRQMVLFVSKIHPDFTISLSDGWYKMNATVDKILAELIKTKKIYVGQKLRICCSKLEGEDACGPLESARKETRLIIRANSVRRAHWSATLGFQAAPFFAVNIASLFANGGPVPFIDVIIQRKYSLLFRENLEDTKITRTQDQQIQYLTVLEQKFHDLFHQNKDSWLQDFEESMEDEFQANPFLRRLLKSSESSSILNSLPKNEMDNLLKQYDNYLRAQSDYIQKETMHLVSQYQPDIVPFFSLSVTDLCPNKHDDADVTLWRVSEEMFHSLAEGKCIRIFNADVSENRNDNLRVFSCTNVTIIESPSYAPILYRSPTFLSSFNEISLLDGTYFLPYSEFDFIGIVIGYQNGFFFICDYSSVIISLNILDTVHSSIKIPNFSVIYVTGSKFVSFDSYSRLAFFCFHLIPL